MDSFLLRVGTKFGSLYSFWIWGISLPFVWLIFVCSGRSRFGHFRNGLNGDWDILCWVIHNRSLQVAFQINRYGRYKGKHVFRKTSNRSKWRLVRNTIMFNILERNIYLFRNCSHRNWFKPFFVELLNRQCSKPRARNFIGLLLDGEFPEILP